MHLSGNLSMTTKTPRKSAPLTASEARKSIKARVSGAYGHGIDRVLKHEDLIENMHRRGQLKPWQYQAAIRYRDAFDIVFGSMGQTLDMDRVRGSGGASMGPSDAMLSAADVLNEADRKLGPMDAALIEMAVGRGYSVEQCAQRIGSRNPNAEVTREDRLETGKRLRMALDILSGHRGAPERLQKPILGFRSGKSAVSAPGAIDRGKVAHAGQGKVEWSGS